MISSLFRYRHVQGSRECKKEGRKKQGSGPRNDRERSSAAFSFVHFFLYLSHRLPSLPFTFLFFLAVSLSLYLSFHLSLSFCFSLFATRRCVWSIVAAARVDSLITLSSSSGPPPPLLFVLRAPSRPRCRRGKRVKRYRRSRARSANRLL